MTTEITTPTTAHDLLLCTDCGENSPVSEWAHLDPNDPDVQFGMTDGPVTQPIECPRCGTFREKPQTPAGLIPAGISLWAYDTQEEEGLELTAGFSHAPVLLVPVPEEIEDPEAVFHYLSCVDPSTAVPIARLIELAAQTEEGRRILANLANDRHLAAWRAEQAERPVED